MSLTSFPIGALARSMPDDCIRLSSSEPEPLSLGDLIGDADLSDVVLGYPHGQGSLALRNAIAGLYASVEPEHIVVFNGAAEAIFATVSVLGGAGGEIVTPTPGHSPFHVVPPAVGARVRAIELLRDEGWALDSKRILTAISADTRAVVLNSPHNPTGTVADPAVLRTVAGVCKERSVRLVVDEIFSGLEFSAAERAESIVEVSPSAVAIGGLSKAAAMAGIRIGWAVSKDVDFLAQLVAVRDYTSLSNSALDERVATLAIARHGELVQRVRSIASTNAALLTRFVEAHADTFSVVKPAGGLLAFPWFKDGRDAAEVSMQLAKDNVLMFPGSVYGSEFSSHFRVGLGRKDLRAALERLGNLVADDELASA